MMRRICENCKWYSPISEDIIRFGECHHDPPTVIPDRLEIKHMIDPESGEKIDPDEPPDFNIHWSYPRPHTGAKSRCSHHSYNPLRNLRRRFKQAWQILRGV